MTANTKQQIQLFHEKCREAGYRVTPQRTEVFRQVMQTDDHPDAESVYLRVHRQFPSVSLDTIYRTLELLEDLGLVSRVSALTDRVRFDTRTEQHHHFICKRCGAVMDFESPEADGLSVREAVRGFGRVDSVRVEVRGVCRPCSEKEAG